MKDSKQMANKALFNAIVDRRRHSEKIITAGL
jgi:hypothetical protein